MATQLTFKKKALAACVALAASHTALAQNIVLEEVVVTAQFVEQNLQDTPIAITAISGKTLEERGHLTVDNIAAQAPNVTLTEGGGYSGPSLIGFIRGVGQTDFNPALEAGVGLYVDDVYYSQLQASILELLDLERVEVLRGPQGTLAGKNSIGGAIKLYSKRPTEEADGYVDVGFGGFNGTSLRAASNFTLIEDELYMRVSGTARSQDGHIARLDYNCANPDNQITEWTTWQRTVDTEGNPVPISMDNLTTIPVTSAVTNGSCKTGEDGGTDYTGVRAALRWLASDTLEANWSVEKVKNEMGAPPSTLIGTYDVAANAPHRVDWNTYRTRFEVGEGGYHTYGNYVDANGLRIPDEMFVDSLSSTLNLDWDLSETLQLQSITGFRDFETAFGTDLDQSPIGILQQYQLSTHKQISQEIRLNGQVGDFMDYTVGGFYFDAETTLAGRIDLGYSALFLDFIHGPDIVNVLNTAVFANTIMHFSDTIDVTLGARFSTDEKDYLYRRRNPDLSDVQGCNGSPADPNTNSNCVLAGLDGTNPDPFEDDRVDYKAAVSWKATDNGMLYAQYSTGFKGGGVNPRPFFTVQASPFNPEELTTVEVGAKWQLLDNRLRINGAYFQNDYTDIQLTLLDCTAYFGELGTPCLAPKNAGNADVSGIELEMDFRPVDNWLIDASISTLDFEYTEWDTASGLTGTEITPFTPETTWSIGTQVDFDAWAGGTLSPRIDANYQDEMQTAAGITPYGQIEERTLVNASLTYLSAQEDWQVRLNITNLTDEYYFTNITDNVNSGHAYSTVGRPQNWTVSFKYNF